MVRGEDPPDRSLWALMVTAYTSWVYQHQSFRTAEGERALKTLLENSSPFPPQSQSSFFHIPVHSGLSRKGREGSPSSLVTQMRLLPGPRHLWVPSLSLKCYMYNLKTGEMEKRDRWEPPFGGNDPSAHGQGTDLAEAHEERPGKSDWSGFPLPHGEAAQERLWGGRDSDETECPLCPISG